MFAKRLLATETLDPNGPLPRWITPAIRRLGWRAWSLPTAEAVHLLGPTGYASLVIQIVRQLRPHVLLVHPPYDFLSERACRKIREGGTRILGLGYDDARFHDAWTEERLRDLRRRFDLWATTAIEGPTVDGGAKSVPWIMAPESVAFDDPAAPSFEAVLIGRCTAERQATAEAVAAAGMDIACFGPGWATGPVTRPSALGLMRRARLVITPSDGVNSNRNRMLEAALLGARQIIEYDPGLERYLAAGERPATYRFAGECAQRLTADEPLPLWTNVPAWESAWPELIADLDLEELDGDPRSPALEQLYASLAHLYEHRGESLAAVACQAAWAYAAPGDPGPMLAMTRCLHRAGEWRDTVRVAREAEAALDSYVSPTATNLEAFLPPSGNGLGASGVVDPTLETTALRLHALLLGDELETAAAEIKAMPEARRQAILATVRRLPARDTGPLTRLLGAGASKLHAADSRTST